MVRRDRVLVIAGEVRARYRDALRTGKKPDFPKLMEEVVRQKKARDEDFHEMMSEVGREMNVGRKKSA